MKLKNKLAVLTMLVATSLFAATGLNDISILVEKINHATDQKERTKLLDELDVQLGQVDKKDVKQAHEIVNNNLKIIKKPAQ